MAALMRGLKFARLFASRQGTVRCISTRRPLLHSPIVSASIVPRHTGNVTLLPHLSATFSSEAIPNEASEGFQSEEVTPKEPTIDSELSKINDSVKRTGRVYFTRIRNVMNQIRKEGSVDEQQSAMLLRCTGNLLVKMPKEHRQNVLRDMLALFENIGATMNVTHYNAILQSYIENDAKFTATEFLAQLESKEIVPNRVTFQLLISKFCADGDTEGASKILEHMKQSSIPINERIFSSFITGYMKQDDIDKANGVMNAMRDSGLDPTTESYGTFLCGYAAKGDIEGIRKTLEDAEKDEVAMRPHNILATIEALAEAGHNEHIPEIIELLKQKDRYNNDAISTVFQLMAAGHYDAATQVYLCLHPARGFVDADEPNMVLKLLIERNSPLEVLLEMGQKINSEGLSDTELESLALFAIQNGRSAYALQILEHLHKNGREVQPHQLMPIFYDLKRRSGSVEDIYRCCGLCLQISEPDQAIHHVSRQAIQYLMQSKETMDDITTKLRALGFKEKPLQEICFFGYLSTGQYEQAIAYANENSVRMMPNLIKTELPKGFKPSKRNMEGLLEALKQCSVMAVSPQVKVNSSIMLNLLIEKNLTQEEAEQLVKIAEEKSLKVPASVQPSIVRLLRGKKVSQEVMDTMKNLIASAEEVKGWIPPTPLEMDKMSIADLEEQYAKMEKMGKNTSNIVKVLLLKYCQAKKVAKVEEMKKLLDDRDHTYQFGTLRTLGSFAATVTKNLSEAAEYLDMLRTQYPDNGIYSKLVLDVAILQAGDNKVEEAFNTIQYHLNNHMKESASQTLSSSYMLNEVCVRLLQTLPDASDVHKMQQLLAQGFIKGDAFSLLRCVIEAYIKSEDTEALVTTVEQFAKEYERVPEYSRVLGLLIKNEDAEKLQRVVDVLGSLLGENGMLHTLVREFVNQGKIKQAKKIFESPNLRPNATFLKNSCEWFYNSNNVQGMKNFVEVTKGQQGVDREEMIFQLIRLHTKMQDMKAALDAFLHYEEENIIPKARTLRYLGKALKNSGMEVPFLIPDAPQKQSREGEKSQRKSYSSLELQALDALYNQNEAKVVSMKTSGPNEEGLVIGDDFVLQEGQLLLERRKYTTFKQLVRALGEAGQVECLEKLGDRITSYHNMRLFTLQQVFTANVKSGNMDGIMEKLSSDPESVPQYVHMTSLKLLSEKQPELGVKLEELIKTHLEENHHMFRVLINHYLNSDRVADAYNLIQKYPQHKKTIRVSDVVKTLYVPNKEQVMLEMKSWFSSEEEKPTLAPIYSRLIALKCEGGDWQGGLSYYNQAMDEGLSLGQLNVRALLILESMLQQNKQPVPWPVGVAEAAMSAREELKNQNST